MFNQRKKERKINNKSNNVILLNSDYKVSHLLEGFWKGDIWHVDDFPLGKERIGAIGTNNTVNFTHVKNPYLREELKYFFYYKIKNEIVNFASLISQNERYIHTFLRFLTSTRPEIKSIIEINYEEILNEYESYLKENRGEKFQNRYITLNRQFYQFYKDYYDEREEHLKDRWNVEKLGIPYNMSRRDRFISFENIKHPYRELLKKYMYQVLLVQQTITYATSQNILKKMYLFFDYIVERYPSWQDLRKLSRTDVEKFLYYIRTREMGGRSYVKNRIPSDRHILECVSNLKRFLTYIKDYEWPEAPIAPIHMIIYPDDYPKRKNIIYADHIKHIPDFVWEQVSENIDKLDPEISKLVIIMEATGFRVSDVCQLKYDCLDYKHDGWWLVGDQNKVKHEKHIVPISNEIVAIVKMQQENIESSKKKERNTNNFLFPVLHGRNKGKAFSQKRVTKALNKLANEYKIIDSNGEIFYFKNHAFRHRYGMTMINNGMNILHVQKLMAHTSPEMTLNYARILDSTLRKEWEKVQNAIRIDVSGNLVHTDIHEQAEENGIELEWIRHNMDSIRLDHGFCVKSPKLNCDFLNQSLEPPCIKNNCRSFHVDSTFLDYYDSQIKQMEEDIVFYKKSGRSRSIELIEPKLKRYHEIKNSIQNGVGIMGMPKNKREYTRSERETFDK